MAVKKSELYSSLWKSCDELRGSMDASQYKDYVLVLLFMKYVSDKGDRLVDIPEGGSFRDMMKLKGKADIGDRMNKIIGALASANDLNGIITVADFNDDEKLGKGKDKVDRLSNLIEIFENPELDFSGNRSENDDLLGDAYEYLMRHFATESGKSKGQFYTPAEVSRIMAKVIGIEKSASASNTLYDPTCGSGSLLLKASDEAAHEISIYGQEKDNATRALAVMNMWLHGKPSAEIMQGNTLADPEFKNERTGYLKTFDYAVANPPFSDKAWSNGLDAENDIFGRFDGMGQPPKKNGDFAYLLHLIKSLKSTGKAAIILPLGVLFRGNAEAAIRRQIVKRGYIKGIIGLPANLFYGTGIAASIIVIDKANAANRKGIFMIDAGKGYMKDGNKNRLRSQDIHKIVDVFNKQIEIPKYSRLVAFEEIADPKNDFNLNIPRYIDSQEEEDIQDIAAHLNGGIPDRDIEALRDYWQVYPGMKEALFSPGSKPGYQELRIEKEQIKETIFSHPEFKLYSDTMQQVFDTWKKKNAESLKSLDKGCMPKAVIHNISEDLLQNYSGRALVNHYNIYQILMDYWAEEMQDDLYELAADGWEAGNDVTRLMKRAAKKGGSDKPVSGIDGLEGRLIPPQLIIQEYFAREQAALDELSSALESVKAAMDEMAEEHTGEDGLLADATTEKSALTKASVSARLKVLKAEQKNHEHLSMAAEMRLSYGDDGDQEKESALLEKFLLLTEEEATLKAGIRQREQALETAVIRQYALLSIEEIKLLVVEKKWMAALESRIAAEVDAISYRLTERIRELAERYETPLPQLTAEVSELKSKVEQHLEKMGYTWS